MGSKKKSKHRIRIKAPSFSISKIVSKTINQPKPQESYSNNTKVEANDEQPNVEVKRSTKPLKRKRKSSFSIATHLEGKKKKDTEKAIDYSNLPKDDFTQEQMLKHWYDYAETLNSRGDQLLYSAMKREDPVLKGNTIICSLLNKTLATRFDSESVKLLQYIREKLNNYSINIETPITKLEEVKQVYTSRDRYDFMLNKNPLLKDFAEKLKLDLA